jgi:hypothetical protein
MSGETRMGDTRVQVWIFAGTGAFLLAAGLVYWFTSYEDAGTVMLLLAAGLAAIAGGWLWVQDRKLARAAAGVGAAHGTDEAEEQYLPHESVWPFAIGSAAFLALSGLVISTWVLIPGVFLLAIGIVGFAAQSRRRD